MILTDQQLERYARHLILKEIGGAGQIRLLQSHAVVIGAGGIGSPLLQYLAGAGVGHITIVDDDIVSLSNLQRQTIFTVADIGLRKVDAAATAIAQINPDVVVTAMTERACGANVASLLRGADVVIDGCDNFTTRLRVADAAHDARIPLVSAAVGQFEGQLATYRGWERDQPCYRCLVGSDPDRPDVSCADQGVIGALTGVLGSLAAIEAVRVLHPFGDDPAGKLLIVDALSFRFRTVTMKKDDQCQCAD